MSATRRRSAYRQRATTTNSALQSSSMMRNTCALVPSTGLAVAAMPLLKANCLGVSTIGTKVGTAAFMLIVIWASLYYAVFVGFSYPGRDSTFMSSRVRRV